MVDDFGNIWLISKKMRLSYSFYCLYETKQNFIIILEQKIWAQRSVCPEILKPN